jgi:Flp pilus assembly pilin Flp
MKTKLLMLILLAPFISFGQIIQIGGDINGGANSESFGWSVSLSDDGNIIAIGAPNADSGRGKAWIYENIGGSWEEIIEFNGITIEDYFGGSVSLNADGSIVAIGANQFTLNEPGYVRIYQDIGGSWIQIGQDIVGESAEDESGFALSLSNDGSIVAIGARGNDGNGVDSGHVRIYQNIGGSWTQIGDDIDGEEALDHSGYSVSLSADGSVVAIGARDNNGGGDLAGHVRVFQNVGGAWTQIGQDIDGYQFEEIGYSVSLNTDGSVVAAGRGEGGSRVFENIEGSWTQIGQDIQSIFYNHQDIVSISAEGSVLAVGSQFISTKTVYIYQNIGGDWTEIGEVEGAIGEYMFGYSVSLSPDGRILAIGAPYVDGSIAFVRIYDLSNVLEIENHSRFDFSVYPNPTTGNVNIQSGTPIDQIEIYNLLGQLVNSNTNQNIIDISSVDLGVYFVKVMDENGNIGTQKVVKQ